jgi:p38 MAP kinase
MPSEWSEYYFDETKWEVKSQYTDLLPLGKGAYGLVCSGNDISKPVDQRAVAIKKLARPFETTVHAKRAYREIKLLKHVSHDNVIQLLDVFTRTDDSDFNDMYDYSILLIFDNH